jgi:hypothetical protein
MVKPCLMSDQFCHSPFSEVKPMNGLSLHCGSNEVERNQLALVPTPEATETWYPIPHTILLDQVEKTLEHNGLQIIHQAHALGHEGNRYFGLLEVRNGDNAHDFSLVVGVRNSHDQTFPAGLVIGSRVFICDNLAFSGEIRICRKHTRWIERDLPQLVEVAVGRLSDQRHKQEVRFLTYKQRDLADDEAHDLVIQALDAQVIPATKIPRVLDEWRDPVIRNSARARRPGAGSTRSRKCSKEASIGCRAGRRLCTVCSMPTAGC